MRSCQRSSRYTQQILRTDDVDLRLKSLEADEHMGPDELYLLDAVHDISSKLKKAFCEPQNTEFCPPLALAKQVHVQTGK